MGRSINSIYQSILQILNQKDEYISKNILTNMILIGNKIIWSIERFFKASNIFLRKIKMLNCAFKKINRSFNLANSMHTLINNRASSLCVIISRAYLMYFRTFNNNDCTYHGALNINGRLVFLLSSKANW